MRSLSWLTSSPQEATAAAVVVVAKVIEDSSPVPEPTSPSLVDKTAASSPASLPSRPLEAYRLPPTSALQTWLGLKPTFVSSTGPWATRPVPAWPPVVGRETRSPEACQHLRSHQLDYLTDQLSNRCFLVGTGAFFSILPHHSASFPTIAGPVGRPLACWGGGGGGQTRAN